MYPDTICWPKNVQGWIICRRAEHRAFCNSQAFTLNVTRADMVRAGCSAGGRLFEAAACGHAHHQPPL